MTHHQYKSKFTAFVASSIDGRISLHNSKMPEWTSKEDWDFLQKNLGRADAVVAGSNTYKAAKARMDKRNTFVLTSQIKTMKKKGSVTFVNPKFVNLPEIFQEYKNIAIVGGGMAYQTMLDYNLLDEIYVTIEPLIFGRGKEMFTGGKKNTNLKLISKKVLNKMGTVLLHYKIIK